MEPLMPLTTHFDEELIEAYALGRLPEKEAGDLEEHLLICSVCQERLERADSFVQAFRVAVHAPKAEPMSKKPPKSAWFGWLGASWQPLPMAAALAVLAIAIVALAPRREAHEGETLVALTAMRGGSSEAIAVAEGHQRLQFDLDATALGGRSYRVELADSRGRQIWQSPTPIKVDDGRVKAALGRSVPGGVYWVRLYDPASGQLVREYGLRVK